MSSCSPLKKSDFIIRSLSFKVISCQITHFIFLSQEIFWVAKLCIVKCSLEKWRHWRNGKVGRLNHAAKQCCLWKKWRAEDHETFRQQIVLKLETSWDHGGPVECKHVIINMAVPKDAGKWKGQSFVDSTHYKDWTEGQSCKMSQIWQIYLCKNIKNLG